MVIKDIEKLGGKLNELLECNIFENTRKSKYVEGRSLLVYLLRDKLKMRWIQRQAGSARGARSVTTRSLCLDILKY